MASPDEKSSMLECNPNSSPRFRQLCICLAFPRVVFVLLMYCTLSHKLGHVTLSANGMEIEIFALPMASCTQSK